MPQPEELRRGTETVKRKARLKAAAKERRPGWWMSIVADPAFDGWPVFDVLRLQRGWGPRTTLEFMFNRGLDRDLTVGEMTIVQAGGLVPALG